MEKEGAENKREYVRAELSTQVQFTVMDAQEYDGIEAHDRAHRFIAEPPTPMTTDDDKNYLANRAFYSNLIHYLMRLDDKLDGILKILSKDDKYGEEIFTGRSLDISGTGMRIDTDKPIEPGQVLWIGFRIFRYPAMASEVYGKAVRVMPVEGQRYEVAVEFLDIDEQCRESIIAYVFQMQREALRGRRNR